MLIECPHCKKKIVASAGDAGSAERCPRCGKPIGMPADSNMPSSPGGAAPSMPEAVRPQAHDRPRPSSWAAPSGWSNSRRGTLGVAVLGTILAVFSIGRRVYEARNGDGAIAVKFDTDLSERHNAAMISMEAYFKIAARWCRGESVDPDAIKAARDRAFQDAKAYVSTAESLTLPERAHASAFRDQARSTASEFYDVAENAAMDIVRQVGDGSPGEEGTRAAVALSLETAAARVQRSAEALRTAQGNFRAASPGR
jgi:hypothetical protein